MATVDVPGLGVVDFPEGMSDDEISSAINSHFDDVADYGVSTATQIPGQVLGILQAGAEPSAEGRAQSEAARDRNASRLFASAMDVMGGGDVGTEAGQERAEAGIPFNAPLVPIPKWQSSEHPYLAAGVNTALALPEFLTTPVGLASIPAGGGAFGPVVQAGTGLAFAADMASGLGEQATQAGEAWDTMTPQQKAETVLGLGSNIVLPAFLAGHAGESFANLASPGRAASQLMREPRIDPALLEELAVLGGDTFAAPGRMIRPPALSPDSLLSDLKLMGRPEKPAIVPKQPVPNLPRSTFRPEVPETAPEPQRNLTVLEEIRAMDARTKEQIRALYPHLSREEAAKLRDQAWPERTNASKEPEATEVHGNVRPLEEPAAELPPEEGSGGVQPQAPGGIPAAAQPEIGNAGRKVPIEEPEPEPAPPGAPDPEVLGMPASWWEKRMKERTLTPEVLRRAGKSLGLPEGADPTEIRKALRQRIAEKRAPKPAPPPPPVEEQADIQKEIGELYGDEGEEPEAPAAEAVPKPPPAPPAAPATEAPKAPATKTDPEAVAKEIGYKYNPTKQLGAFKLELPPGASQEDIARMEALKAAMPVQWEFTHPETGATFYVPEGSSPEAIKARAAEVTKAFAETKPVEPETKAAVPETPSGPWYESKGEQSKQSIFAAMRAIQARVDAAAERERALRPRQGEIAAGAVGFDEFINSEAQAQVLRAIRKGATPEQAEKEAKAWAREAVAIHNRKRPKDVDWQRWEGTADSAIERAVGELRDAVSPKVETIRENKELAPKPPLPPLLEVPKDKGLRGRRAQLVRMIEALSTVDPKTGKVIPNDNVSPERWAQLNKALNEVEKQIAGETPKPVAQVEKPAPSPVAPEEPKIPTLTEQDEAAAQETHMGKETPYGLAVFRVKRAKTDFRKLGPWAAQRDQDARARWQRAKAELQESEAALEKIRPKPGQPAPAAPAAPEPVDWVKRMQEAKDANEGRTIIAEHEKAIEALQRSMGQTPTVGRIEPNYSRGFSTVKPKEWQSVIKAALKLDPAKAKELRRLVDQGNAMREHWEKLYDRSMAQYREPGPKVAPVKKPGAAPDFPAETREVAPERKAEIRQEIDALKGKKAPTLAEQKLRQAQGRLGMLKNARAEAVARDADPSELEQLDEQINFAERQASKLARPETPAAAPAPAKPQASGRPPTSEKAEALRLVQDKLRRSQAALDAMPSAVELKWNSPEMKRRNALATAVKRLEAQAQALGSELHLQKWAQETAPYRSPEARAAVPQGTRNITAKVLEAQRANLLEQIDGALKKPAEGDKVTFKVPGDGQWTITNTPDNLKAFKAKIAKEFPKTVPADPNKLPGKASASSPQPAKLGEPAPEDLGKIVGPFNSDDQSREAITAAYSDGTQIVATDGRQLIRVAGATPGSPNAPVRIDSNGKPVTLEGKYPNYTTILNGQPNLLMGGADTKDLFHIVRQAEALRKFNPKDKQNTIGVSLYVNPDRTFGAHLKDLSGDTYTHNVQEGAKHMGTYNPEYILNAIQAARELGNAKVDLYRLGDDETSPLSFVGKNHESVVMGIRTEGAKAADKASDFAAVAGKAQHRRIPLGLGPMPDVNSPFTTPVGGTGGKLNVKLEDGKITIRRVAKEENKGQPGYWSGPDKWEDLATFPIEEMPKGKGQKAYLETKLKGKGPQGWEKLHTANLIDAIKSVTHDRNEAAKEVNQRNRDAGSPDRLAYFSGIPFPGAQRVYDTISRAAQAVAHGDFIGPIQNASKAVRDAWHRFAMQQAPRFTDMDRRSGELAVRAAQAPLVGRTKGLLFADKVVTDSGAIKPAADFDLKLGTALTEDNLQDLKARFERLADEAENREEYAEQAREGIAELAEAVQDRDPDAMRETNRLRRDLERYESYTDADAADFTERANKVTSLIGVKGSPFETEEAYQAFLKSPEARAAIRRHIQRWQEEKDPIFRKANDLDPDQPLESRGLQTGARINLAPIIDPADGTPTTVGFNARPGLIRQAATRLRRDRFGLPASGSAPSYEGSYREIMAKGFEHEYPVAAQHEFINRLLDSDLAKLGAKEFPDITIRGEPVKAYEYKIRNAPKQWIYVPKSLAKEYEDIMGLHGATRIPYYTAAGEFLTRQSVKGLAEGSTHAANLLMEVFTGAGPTANPMLNALLKAAGRSDLFIRIPQVIIGAMGDKREAMLNLLEMGAAKEAYRGAGPMTWFINKVDQGVRLNAASIFDRMAASGWVENTETNKREFIAQVGNYNKRLQPRLIQMLRDTHIQPFATAQHTFNVMGARRLAMSPGVKASSNAAALALRADIAAGWLGFAAIVGTLNYMLNGNVTGPPGTRLGAVGWVGDDKRVHQFDVGRFTGFTRGARALGLQGMVEAHRLGLNTQAQLEALAQGPASVGVGMVSGPINRGATIALTGKRPGFPMVQEADVMPPQTEKNFQLRKTQAFENIATAVREANPLVDLTTGLANVAQGKEEPDLVRRQLSRYMPTAGPKPETIKALPAIVEQSQLKTYAEAFAREARRQPPLQRMKWVKDKMATDEVAPELRPRLLRELQKHGVFSRP